MTGGEVGIVISFNPRDRLRPKVLMLLDDQKRWYQPERIVDLSKIADERREQYKITRVLDAGSHGISLEEYMDLNFLKYSASNPVSRRN